MMYLLLGSTVFIEPIQIFDLNNELNNLKAEENIEIAKILTELSKKLASFTNELKNNLNLIGEIDFIFAKASYSKSIEGINPKISIKKQINLIDARHPLIDKNKIVPISISVGENYSSLVITGPNTGRKNCSIKNLWTFAFNGI